jgi:hypothetical protein
MAPFSDVGDTIPGKGVYLKVAGCGEDVLHGAGAQPHRVEVHVVDDLNTILYFVIFGRNEF